MKYLLQITKSERANDIVLMISPNDDLAAVDIVRDLKDCANDGWRLISVRDTAVDTEEDIASYTLRSREGIPATISAKAELHISTESTVAVVTYDTIAEAVTAINSLNASDGFLLIDEYDQEPKSKIIYERPSLWKQSDYIGDEEFLKSHGRANNHGRTDNDRY